jgi:outer membrane PBP1 activator LpoA protein
MLHRLRRVAQTSLLLAVSAAVVGCATGLSGGDPERAQAARAEAIRLEGTGAYAQAAQAWFESAQASRGGQREVALIESAQAWLLARDVPAAQQTVAQFPAGGEPALAVDRALVEAEVAMKSGDPAGALGILGALSLPEDSPRLAEVLAARADANFANDNTAAGVSDLVARERLLPPPERPSNQRRLWNRLQEAAARGAPMATPPGADPTVAGWLELGRITASGRGSPFQLRAAILGWQQRNPGHPAAAGVTQELLIEARALAAYPTRVALLLPLSGRQALAGQAVRDGFVGGYLSMRPEGEAPTLSVYDTGALGSTAAYEQAVRDGAEFIVGPLLKEELAEIAAALVPAVPTLALNWADDATTVPDHIAEFALAPEDEAAAAARRAMEEGLCRALALVPDTDQGRRMAESFASEMQAGGCALLGWQRFFAADRDFSSEITSLMLIEESAARHQRVQGLLGQSLEFEPRRRQDAEFLFLAARPSEGRLIRPQLKFHFAGDLPVYATSSIYQPGERGNADLDGIRFADMPWRVGASETDVAMMARFNSFGPGAVERNGRLYAFGADAWRLVPFVHNRSGQLTEGVPGLTGTLFVDADGRVHRRLAWGRFAGGEVVPLPPVLPPEPPTEAGPGE